MNNFKKFIKSKSASELSDFAEKCGTTVGYIQTQLVGAYRKPGTSLWLAIVRESKGELTNDDMFEHFMKLKEA